VKDIRQSLLRKLRVCHHKVVCQHQRHDQEPQPVLRAVCLSQAQI